MRAIDAAGFTEPRPIQKEALPHALAGRDVLGLAQTGTGKTAAFALPILERIVARGARPKVAPRTLPAPMALVVAPTRELASQIHAEFLRLGKFTPLVAAVVFGGVGQGAQERELARHPDVLVACPGRLLDLLSQRLLTLEGVTTLVLDEADHMFDMGFLPSIRRIVAQCPKRRQNLFFSATMPPELRKLANDLLVKPAVVELAHSRPPEQIEHALYHLEEGQKLPLLRSLLGSKDFRSAIVFTRTKHRAKRLAQQLERQGHRAVALQGNLSQNQRERAMGGFRSGAFDVLVATDIAARGIDVEQVSHVVNFDLPTTPEAYTHRIGRTGRSERSGRAYSFATSEDGDMVRAIEKHLGSRLPRAGQLPESVAEAGPGAAADFSRAAPPARGSKGSRRSGGSRGAASTRVGEARSGASSGGHRPGAKPAGKGHARPDRAARTRSGEARSTASAPARERAGPTFGAGI